MLPLCITLISALAMSLGVTRLVRDVAVAVGAVDRVESSRKIHKTPVPRMGGLGIVAGVFGSLTLALTLPGVSSAFHADRARLLGLAVAGAAVAALGLFDDLRGVGAKAKLTVQVGGALLLYGVGYRIDVVANPFGPDVVLGALALPVTVLWIAGLSNAVNLIDGLDGLAGGIAFVATVVVLALSAHGADLPAMLIAAALAGGILGFLAFNVNPASIFMGDTGSLFLGMVLAALALRPHAQGSEQGVPLLAMVVALGVPIADTAVAMARRAARGMPMFAADREHLHHRLLDLGLTHRHAVMALWLATTLLAAAGVYVAVGTEKIAALVLVVTISAAALLLSGLGLIRAPSAELRVRRERNRARLAAVRTIGDRLRRATRLADIGLEVAAAAPVLEAAAVSLRLAAEGSEVIAPEQSIRAQYPLDPAEPQLGAVEIVWPECRGRIDRDTEIVIETLCRSVARNVERLEPRPDLTSGVVAAFMRYVR